MKKIVLFFSILLSITSCKKDAVSAPDDFTVTTDKLTYSVKDTIKFYFSGDPDYITFYSGEVHNKWANSAVFKMQADSNILTFSTATTASSTTTQPLSVNNVALLASTDFSGIMDSANIRKATWKNISTNAIFATTTTTVISGNIHADSLTRDSLPLYLAFRYTADTAKATYLSRKWILSAFSLKSYFKDTTYPLANSYTSGGFYSKSIANPFNTWIYGNTSSITQTLTFNAPAVGSLPDEDWAISRPFNLSFYPPDLGVSIKDLTSNKLAFYNMGRSFLKPGTYTVTFVAKNQNSEATTQVVRQVVLTITP